MAIKRLYFCANAWISLTKKEVGRYEPLEQVIIGARGGECEIWTSSISYAEVYKSAATGTGAEESDKKVDDLFEQDFVQRVEAGVIICRKARVLLRQFPTLKKPFDAIHLATAVKHNCDEFYTFDRENLLGLNGLVEREDGTKLIIKKPELQNGPLWDAAKEKDEEAKKTDPKE